METARDLKNSILDDENEFENLVLNGGGILGLAFCGSFKAMNNLDKMKYIKRVIGTSVGSLFGVLAVCKCTNSEIDVYRKKFYKELTELDETSIQQGINMYEHLGLHDNKNIKKVVDDLLFEKYGKHNMNLLQLYEATGVEYTAVTMCLNTRKAVYQNHVSNPTLDVGEAVLMSAAVPFFFVQVKYHGMVFVDGGAVDNMPIDYYDSENGKFNDKTLGMHFSRKKQSRYKSDTLIQVLEGIENSQMENNEVQSIQNYDKRSIIEIDVDTIEAFNFDLTKSKQIMLETNGYKAVPAFYHKREQNKTKDTVQIGWIPYIKSFVM
jgi:NTE family protein